MSSSDGGRARAIASCICMVGIALCWVSKSEVLQRLQTNESFDQPLTIGFICTCTYIIFIIILAIIHVSCRHCHDHRYNGNGDGNGHHRHHHDGQGQGGDQLKADDTTSMTIINASHDSKEIAFAAPLLNSPSSSVSSATVTLTASLSASILMRWYDRVTPIWILGNGNDRIIALRMLRASTWLTVLFFINSYLYTASLSRTAVSTNTIIGNSSCVVVFALSVLFLHQPVTVLKLFALVVSITGVVIIGYYPSIRADDGDGAQTDAGSDTLVGVLAVTASTVIYSVFEVAFRYFTEPPAPPAAQSIISDNILSINGNNTIKNHDNSNGNVRDGRHDHGDNDNSHDKGNGDVYMASIRPTLIFLGSMGILTMILCSPLLAVAHITGLESFQWPSSRVWPLLICSALLDCALQLCVLLACVWSSPLLVSIGSLISIPSSIISDHILHASLPSSNGWIGISFIIISFIATIIPDASCVTTHPLSLSSLSCSSHRRRPHSQLP